MADFRVPKGATGFRMEDGTRYEARPDGRISVDNPAHVSAVERANRNSSGRIGKVVHGAGRGVGGRECRCGFMAYLWQTICPRCGAKLRESEAA